MPIRSTAFLVSLALALGACANKDEKDEEGSGCTPTTCPFDYSSFDGTGPEVSLKNDLLADKPPTGGSTKLGIFRRACNFASDCHGREAGEAGLYLGPPSTNTSSQNIAISPEDITDMLEGGQPITLLDGGMSDPVPRGIINVPSKTLPSMVLVKPGDPANSFLMRKVDSCFEGLSGCTPQATETESGHPCGDRMPQGSKTLCEDERNMIRRWIAQGAKNN